MGFSGRSTHPMRWPTLVKGHVRLVLYYADKNLHILLDRPSEL